MSRICVYTHCPLELIRSRVYLRVMGSHLCSQTTEMDELDAATLYDILHALTATDDLPVVCTTILCRLFQAFTAYGYTTVIRP